MNPKISICLFLVVLNVVSIQCQRLVRTLDLMPSLRSRRDFNGTSDYEFDILGEKYTVTSKRTVRNIPVTLIGDNGFQLRSSDVEHELYYDENNGAAFTISTRNVNGVVQRSLHGTAIKRDGTQLILEPFSYNKRSLLEPMTAVYEREFELFTGGNDYVKRNFDDEFDMENKMGKRELGSLSNYVELGMVADFLYFEKVKEHLKTDDIEKISAFIEANFVQIALLTSQVYERTLADSDVKILVVLKFIYILTSESVSPFSTTTQFSFNGNLKDGSGKVYLKFGQYLNELNSWSAKYLKDLEYDALVSLTGGNLAHDSMDSINGVAVMNGACRENSNSFVVEDRFDFLSFTTLAHELAHNLGVNHDPSDNALCAGYVMGSAIKGADFFKSFLLSPCSVETLISEVYFNNKFTCLSNRVELAKDFKKYEEFYPGQVYPLIDQCKKSLYGPTSIPVIDEEQEIDICRGIFCSYIDDYIYSLVYTPIERTTCGSGKWCVGGVCTEDSRVPTGDCLVPTDVEFCDNYYNLWGTEFLCDLFGRTVCCEYCNPGKTTIPSLSLKTLNEWLEMKPAENVIRV